MQRRAFTPTPVLSRLRKVFISFPSVLKLGKKEHKSTSIEQRSFAGSKQVWGFTLMETLIVLGIIGLLTVIVLFTFAHKGADKQLDADTLNVKTLLEEARSLTLSAKDASSYGVHFETHKIVLFTGTSYTAGLSTNKESLLGSSVEISSINLVSGSDVVFNRLTGGTSQSGTVTLRLVADTSKIQTVTINAVGTVE